MNNQCSVPFNSPFFFSICIYKRNNVLWNDEINFETKIIFSPKGMRRGGRGSSRGQPRTVPTAEELDAELDAYVNKVK